jgi:hypothetical protein
VRRAKIYVFANTYSVSRQEFGDALEPQALFPFCLIGKRKHFVFTS